MDLVLQLWGGGLYLLNKVCFAAAEAQAAQRQRQLRIAGWIVYLLGVPAWVIILVSKQDWIAASIEAGGIPAMLFGLYNACQRGAAPARRLDLAAALCTYASLLFGVSYSVYDYGGLTTGSQVLELGVMTGFLVGSYLLAKKNARGWLFFMLMNGSMAALMWTQGKPLLAVQQLVSLGFVLYGFRMAEKTSSPRRTGPGQGR